MTDQKPPPEFMSALGTEYFHNHYWPALYFIDADGIVRDRHFGEGRYEQSDAEWAARRWAPGQGLSLAADRLCMALGDRLDADIWTADRAWGTAGRIRQVR